MVKSSFVKFFVDRDIFGSPVTVLYKGSDTYKTIMGALCTVLVIVLVLVNSFILAQGYISQSRQTETAQNVYLDLYNAGKFYLEENKVRMRIASFTNYKGIPENIGRFRVQHEKTDKEGNNQINEIPLQVCSQEEKDKVFDYFANRGESLILLDDMELHCFDHSDIYLEGDKMHDGQNFSQIHIDFVHCSLEKENPDQDCIMD